MVASGSARGGTRRVPVFDWERRRSAGRFLRAVRERGPVAQALWAVPVLVSLYCGREKPLAWS